MKTKILNVFRNIFKLRVLENYLIQFIANKPIDNFWSKLAPNNYQYPTNSLRRFNYKGIELELDISDYVGHYLYFGFKDEGHEQLMRLVKNENTILDIGTNYGTTILQFAKLIGNQGKCYGFEPDPYNFKVCQRNLKLNDFKNIFVENVGLGKESAELFLVVDTETNRSGNRISSNIKGKESYKVPIICIDNWIIEKEIAKIDLIKIDVEGFELNVLKGAEQSLKEFNPTLFIELDDTNLKEQGNSAKELVSYLASLRYKMTNSLTNKLVDVETDFTNCHYDIICTPIS